MSPHTLSAGIGLVVTLVAGAALADSGRGPAVTLPDIVIIGRVQKPLATVEVARVQPKLTLTELRRPFTVRIEQAVARDPY